mmetsp:Transcript_29666/g.70696  ORF Transcript_29666/g.70696 Transcript_29666/m.70696 type:complete len:216 (+) Transcript_29666:245-892(+)
MSLTLAPELSTLVVQLVPDYTYSAAAGVHVTGTKAMFGFWIRMIGVGQSWKPSTSHSLVTSQRCCISVVLSSCFMEATADPSSCPTSTSLTSQLASGGRSCRRASAPSSLPPAAAMPQLWSRRGSRSSAGRPRATPCSPTCGRSGGSSGTGRFAGQSSPSAGRRRPPAGRTPLPTWGPSSSCLAATARRASCSGAASTTGTSTSSTGSRSLGRSG